MLLSVAATALAQSNSFSALCPSFVHCVSGSIAARVIQLEMKINNTKRSLKLKLRDFDKASRETELIGLENHLAELVGKYNSKSRQITRKYFKSETLPYQLSYTDSLLKLDMNTGETQ